MLRENKCSKSCSNGLRAKVRFEESWISFLQKRLIKCLEKMLKELQKQAILCPLSSSKSLLLGPSGSISEKIMKWHQKLTIKTIQKDVDTITRSENIVTNVVEEKFGFNSFDKSFELQRNIICYARTSLHCSNATNWKKIEWSIIKHFQAQKSQRKYFL